MGVGGQRCALAVLPPGKTRYPLYRRLGGPQGRCGRVQKISPTLGFDLRTVQPVASRYTDCAIPALCIYIYIYYINLFLYNGFRLFPGVNRPERGFNYVLPSSTEVKGTVELPSTPTLCLHVVLWDELKYVYTKLSYIYTTNVAWPNISYRTKTSCPCLESNTSPRSSNTQLSHYTGWATPAPDWLKQPK